MKRFLHLTALICAALLLISVFSACGGDADVEDETTTDPAQVTTVPVIQIPEGWIRIDIGAYKVVRPSVADKSCIAAVTSLKQQLDDLSGGNIAVADDWVKNTSEIPVSANEVLIGATNRPQSNEALATLDGMRFSVRYDTQSGRIVITASRTSLLCDAVNYFIAECVKVGTDGIYIPPELNYISDEYKAVEVVTGSMPLYHIRYPGDANDVIKAEYLGLKDAIDKLTGTKEQTIGTDILSKNGKYDSAAYEILLGDTDCPESAQVLSELRGDEYGIFVVGNKIVVRGATRRSTVLAIAKFEELLSGAVIKGEGGKVDISFAYGAPMIYRNDSYPSLAVLPDAPLSNAYDCGDNELALIYSELGQNVYGSFIDSLVGVGMQQTFSHTAGQFSYSVHSDGKVTLYARYSTSAKTARLIVANARSASMSALYTENDNYQKVCTPSLTQLALSYTADNTNGMGYVIQLSDGSFIIYDGGFTADAKKILDCLCSKSDGGKPYVRAWVLTHMHGDHIQAFREFASSYADQIKLDYLILNVADEYYDVDAPTAYGKGLIKSALSCFTGARMIKPHAGEVFVFADAKLEVIYTHELLYPVDMLHGNNTSLVTRLSIGGQTVLFPGDCEEAASNVMCADFGDYLKSTFVQVSHHGSEKYSATTEFYRYVSPTYVLFPGSQSRYRDVSKTEVNSLIIRLAGSKNVFVADNGNKTFVLPYSG